MEAVHCLSSRRRCRRERVAWLQEKSRSRDRRLRQRALDGLWAARPKEARVHVPAVLPEQDAPRQLIQRPSGPWPRAHNQAAHCAYRRRVGGTLTRPPRPYAPTAVRMAEPAIAPDQAPSSPLNSARTVPKTPHPTTHPSNTTGSMCAGRHRHCERVDNLQLQLPA